MKLWIALLSGKVTKMSIIGTDKYLLVLRIKLDKRLRALGEFTVTCLNAVLTLHHTRADWRIGKRSLESAWVFPLLFGKGVATIICMPG